MRSAWRTWLVFVCALLIVIAAMSWVSARALESARKADYEESVRLALWRLDSSLAPLILQESARPYLSYRPFYSPGASHDSSEEAKQNLLPSPLLTEEVPSIILHFELREEQIFSPQVPEKSLLPQARELGLPVDLLSDRTKRFQKLQGIFSIPVFTGCVRNACGIEPLQPEPANTQKLQGLTYQSLRNQVEFEARTELNRQVLSQNDVIANANLSASRLLSVSGMHAVWLEGQLFLTRLVRLHGQELIQACWIDWNHLRQSLLDQIDDLFPAASLSPVQREEEPEGSRSLTLIPLQFEPGELATGLRTSSASVFMPLGIAWACVTIFAIASAVLLRTSVSLSQRRGAFVSAVTHELRTPLTTFQMYTEMLSTGMVGDTEKRQRYLDTLSTEATRLGHMVENVLSYSRLENSTAPTRLETLTANELMERVFSQVTERARLGNLDTTYESSGLEDKILRVSVSTVEQILLNLIDNACKYARPSKDDRVVVRGHIANRHLVVSVRDHGPGVAPEDRRRLFRAFSKSAHEAASSAPGIGLGLALSRRLARDLGGELLFREPGEGPGACFELRLPLSA